MRYTEKPQVRRCGDEENRTLNPRLANAICGVIAVDGTRWKPSNTGACVRWLRWSMPAVDGPRVAHLLPTPNPRGG